MADRAERGEREEFRCSRGYTGVAQKQELTAPNDAGRLSPDWLTLTLACIAQFMVVLDSNYHQ